MVNSEVKKAFRETSLKYMGNTNSLHKLGVEAKRLENAATKQICDVLRLNQKEVIYTADRNEANSLAIFGLLEKYKYKNKKIIYFDDCDKSIIDSLSYINNFGFRICCLGVDKKEHLGNLLDNDVILICMSNTADIKYIKSITSGFNHINILVDITDNFDTTFDFNLANLVVFDARSINAILGIGCLIKDKSIVLEPVLHGGKSTTSYRSGTPALPFIVAFSKSLKNMYK